MQIESRSCDSKIPDDAATQLAVLGFLLAEYPEQLTETELAREMLKPDAEFGERDAFQRAVRDLVGVGLLHRHGEFVLPTRAARGFDRLEEA